jgi:hypothetical protein
MSFTSESLIVEENCRWQIRPIGLSMNTTRFGRTGSLLWISVFDHLGTDANGYYGCGPGYAEADYTYNANGQMASYGTSLTQWGYPAGQPNSQVVVAGPVYTYGYDSMARPASLRDDSGSTWVQNGQYDFAGRIASLQTYWTSDLYTGQPDYTVQTMTWNANG